MEDKKEEKRETARARVRLRMTKTGCKTRNVCRTKNGKVSNKNYYLQQLNLSYYPKRDPAMCVKAGLSAQASAVFIR